MPKRIVICFDGTWNTPAEPVVGLQGLYDWMARLGPHGSTVLEHALETIQPGPEAVETNVCRFYRSVVRRPAGRDGMGQVKWYDAGIGTNWYDRVTGGAFGLGLSQNIRQGYHYLASVWDPGDEIYVLGFSRGAYTARSLVGMIRNCGLLPRGGIGNGPNSDAMLEAYELYRMRGDDVDSERAQNFRRMRGARAVEIAFLGVWDTVGALGIPIQSFAQFDSAVFRFHDTELSGIVRNGFHAIAVDEHREPYAVTLWDPKQKLHQRVEQRWFVGAHCDVGGGYPDRRLSDITLAWMQEKAAECGLVLHAEGIPAITPAHALGPSTDSYANFMSGLFSRFSQRFYRPVRRTRFGQELVHDTVQARMLANFAYRPRNPGLFDA